MCIEVLEIRRQLTYSCFLGIINKRPKAGACQCFFKGHFKQEGHDGPGSLTRIIFPLQNILVIPGAVSEKNFEIGPLCSYFLLCDPKAGLLLTPGASYEQTWSRSTRRCYIPNIKALRQQVLQKKNFEVCLICSNV